MLVHASMRVQEEERCIRVEVYSYCLKCVHQRPSLGSQFFLSIMSPGSGDPLKESGLLGRHPHPQLSYLTSPLIFEVLADFSNIKKIPLNSRNTQFSNSLTWKTWWSFMAYDFWIGLAVFIVVEHLPFIHPTPASLRHFKIKD